MPVATPVELLHELHSASVDLLQALRQRNPGYLEHLERRDHALRALQPHLESFRTHREFQESLAAGAAAVEEARTMRRESVRQLDSLQTQRRYSERLAASVRVTGQSPDYQAMDVTG